DKDVEHALLSVKGADLDDFLGVSDGCFFDAFQLDVGFDEFHGAVSTGRDRLRGRAGEPVNHGAAGDQAEDKRGVQQRELVYVTGKTVGQSHDDREDHGGSTDDGRADQHRFGGGLEGVTRAVIGFQQFFGAMEVRVDVVFLLEFLGDI